MYKKRIIATLCAALALCLLVAGCGNNSQETIQLTDPAEGAYSDPSAWETESQATDFWGVDPWEATETETEGTETSVTTAQQSATAKPATQRSAATTKPATATTKPTTKSATTAKTTTKATTITTKQTTTTTKATTKGNFANPISISSKDAALSAFNAAIDKVFSSKPGFAKSHMITYKDWKYDPALLEGLNIPLIGDPTTYLTQALNAALNKGVRTASGHKGDSTSLLKNSNFTMGDMKDVTYSGATNSDWTITLNVKDGETRQEKKLFGSGATGNSPIDKGPLHLATGDGSIYDHMTADRVFSMVKSQLSFVNADPIDVSESTSQAKFVAKLDGGGALRSLMVTYNQTINLKEIKIMNGITTYKDNTGSSTVTITFDQFEY